MEPDADSLLGGIFIFHCFFLCALFLCLILWRAGSMLCWCCVLCVSVFPTMFYESMRYIFFKPLCSPMELWEGHVILCNTLCTFAVLLCYFAQIFSISQNFFLLVNTITISKNSGLFHNFLPYFFTSSNVTYMSPYCFLSAYFRSTCICRGQFTTTLEE